MLETIWVPNYLKPQFLVAGELLNARLASVPCDTWLKPQLSISSNSKPTSSTGMTTPASPAYSHINAFSSQSSHCLPELAQLERGSQPCQEHTGPACPPLPWGWHSTGMVGCHSPAATPALRCWPGTRTEPWNSTQATCTGWKEDKS